MGRSCLLPLASYLGIGLAVGRGVIREIPKSSWMAQVERKTQRRQGGGGISPLTSRLLLGDRACGRAVGNP